MSNSGQTKADYDDNKTIRIRTKNFYKITRKNIDMKKSTIELKKNYVHLRATKRGRCWPKIGDVNSQISIRCGFDVNNNKVLHWSPELSRRKIIAVYFILLLKFD